jgi:hypothetical protein
MSASSELFGGGGTPKKWAAGNYNEGTVVWSPSDYQYYMRKTTGASATDPASDLGNWQPTGDRAIKSIQRGSAGGSTQTVTISAVNVNKSSCFVNGYAKNSSGIVDCVIAGYLANATSITTNTNSGLNGGGSWFWEVIERY